MLAIGTLIVVLDSLASEVVILDNAFGIDGSVGATISGKAVGVRDMLSALDDATVQHDVTPVAARRVPLLIASSFYPALQGLMIGRALDSHYGGVGSLNRFLTEQNARVHPNLRKMGIQIDSRNVFRDTVLDPVAQYEGTGAGSGDFVAGSDVDTSVYGEASLELVVEAMGAIARTLRLTAKRYDGSTEVRDVVVPALTAPGTALPVGAAEDRYVGIAGIVTVEGGANLDAFRVRTKVERML